MVGIFFCIEFNGESSIYNSFHASKLNFMLLYLNQFDFTFDIKIFESFHSELICC